MEKPQNVKAAAPAATGNSGELGNCCSSQAPNGYPTPHRAASEDPDLRAGAARHDVRLTDRFGAEDVERGDPRSYLERYAGAFAPTSAYGGTAELAFQARLLELDGGGADGQG